jgi:hypothetical protein
MQRHQGRRVTFDSAGDVGPPPPSEGPPKRLQGTGKLVPLAIVGRSGLVGEAVLGYSSTQEVRTLIWAKRHLQRCLRNMTELAQGMWLHGQLHIRDASSALSRGA